MERMSVENQKGILYMEHIHRYQFIQTLVSGSMLDIACGIGYGSYILENSFDDYIGVDYSHDAIADAVENNEKEGISFFQGDIRAIDFLDNQFDIVSSFETLEHILEYDKALSEVLRVLKEDGLFVGSVPSEEYDDICEKVYGKNPYHIQRFDFTTLKNALSKYFKFIDFYSNELMTFNTFKNINFKDEKLAYKALNDNKVYGSIIFIATNCAKQYDEKVKKLKSISHPLMRLVEYDQSMVRPLRDTIDSQEKLVIERDRVIKSQTMMIDERDRVIKSQTMMIDERDRVIKSQAIMIDERDKYILELERRING